MKKKLIGFSEILLEKIDEYSKETGTTFTEAVRNLVEIGLNRLNIPTRDGGLPNNENESPNDDENESPNDDPFVSIFERIEKLEKNMTGWNLAERISILEKEDFSKRVEKLEQDMSWWNADENESKVSRLEYNLNELEKKINILIEISKKFKGHLNNREIHLQD